MREMERNNERNGGIDKREMERDKEKYGERR